VDAPVDVLHSVVNHLMSIIADESFIGEQEIGIESGPSFN
jgi:hypothetical protein